MTGFVTRLLTIWSEMKPIWSGVIIYPNSSKTFLDNLKIGSKGSSTDRSADIVSSFIVFWSPLRPIKIIVKLCRGFKSAEGCRRGGEEEDWTIQPLKTAPGRVLCIVNKGYLWSSGDLLWRLNHFGHNWLWLGSIYGEIVFSGVSYSHSVSLRTLFVAIILRTLDINNSKNC